MSVRGKLAWAAIVLLAIGHQDFWLWGDRTLLLGFLPIGLAWHVGLSLASGLAWLAVVRWAWPDHVEQWAATEEPPRGEA